MTEAEWLACRDIDAMLGFAGSSASDRRLRLFSVAACRHSLQCFGHYDLSEAVDWAELLADGTAVGEPSEAIIGAVGWATSEMCESLNCLGEVVGNMIVLTAFECGTATRIAKAIIEAHQIADVRSTPENELCKQLEFLRDIFGNPFRPVAVAPEWLTSTVLALARGIYEERAFDRMPILADALQDAGCENDDILNHCRGPGPHVRGCWVVDLVLGKE